MGLRERWNACTAVDSSKTPWHFTARRTKFHRGSRRSADGWSLEDKLGQKIATTKGNVTASWRQRNLRSGWRIRQYELTTWLRQRRRRAISQWIGVILYGFRHRSRSGRSRCVQRSVEFTYEREINFSECRKRTVGHVTRTNQSASSLPVTTLTAQPRWRNSWS